MEIIIVNSQWCDAFCSRNIKNGIYTGNDLYTNDDHVFILETKFIYIFVLKGTNVWGIQLDALYVDHIIDLFSVMQMWFDLLLILFELMIFWGKHFTLRKRSIKMYSHIYSRCMETFWFHQISYLNLHFSWKCQKSFPKPKFNFYNLEQFETGSFPFDPKTWHYLQPENLLFWPQNYRKKDKNLIVLKSI